MPGPGGPPAAPGGASKDGGAFDEASREASRVLVCS